MPRANEARQRAAASWPCDDSAYPRIRKPRVSISRSAALLTQTSREIATVESLRGGRGSGSAWHSPLVDPGPRYGFGTSVGIVDREVCIGPASRTSGLGRDKSQFSWHLKSGQGCRILAGVPAVGIMIGSSEVGRRSKSRIPSADSSPLLRCRFVKRPTRSQNPLIDIKDGSCGPCRQRNRFDAHQGCCNTPRER